MNKYRFICFMPLAVLFFGAVPSHLYASAPVELGDQKMEALRLSWKKSADEYRDALVVQKGEQNKLLAETDTALGNENDPVLRKKIMVSSADLRLKIEEISDKIRALNAADLVEYSKNKNKIISFFAGTQ